MFHSYIFEKLKGRLYIGDTDNPDRRLEQHNSPEGKEHLGKYTHRHGPWVLGRELFEPRPLSVQREMQLKSWKSLGKVRALLSAQR
jgi:predicted GIY-YIG superfamily endonuclease